MDTKTHWEHVYSTKTPDQTSWFNPHLRTSLDWIVAAAPDRSTSIIDVGGGESTLVDDLLAADYRSIAVLDIAQSAMEKSKRRIGSAAASILWMTGDITTVPISQRAFDVWHDRAVFHFLTEPTQREAYIRQLTAALKTGGTVILATFALDGPEKCSGLETRRYDAGSLARELGPQFSLARTERIIHQTPFGTTQNFVYCQFRFTGAG